jgi:pimeloyl-ACP methyl ester carboxylesterase
MAAWPSADIHANGMALHYTRTGGARPALVLAHGLSDDGLCWTPVAEELAPDYDVVMVDARGHGRSEAPQQGYGPVEHAGDLAGVIAGLGLRHPILLGHSMGAMTVLTLAGRYPDLPRAILLEDPPPRWMETPVPDEAWRKMEAWIVGLQRQTRGEIIAARQAEAPHWPAADLGPWADSKLRFNLNAFNRMVETHADVVARLRRITCPALLITADPERGAIVTEAAAAGLRALVPGLRIAHVAAAGHSIRRDQFERYVEAVRGFLADLA